MASAHPPADTGAREQRAEPRRAVDQVPQGRVTLRTRGRDEPVRRIRDLSDHGLCLLLDHALEPGEPVMLLQDLAATAPPTGPAAAAGSWPGNGPHPADLPADLPAGLAESPPDPTPTLAPPHAYRGYVVWCRALDDAAGATGAASGPNHFIAGLRVHDTYTLDHLVQRCSH